MKTNWQHLWKESIASYEPEKAARGSADRRFSIPTDLVSMVMTISSLVKSLQGNFGRRIAQLNTSMAPGSAADVGANKDKGNWKRHGYGKGRGKHTGGNGNAGNGNAGNQSGNSVLGRIHRTAESQLAIREVQTCGRKAVVTRSD